MKKPAFIIFVLLSLYARAAQPPFPSRDAGTEENFNVIYNKMSSHRHDNDGSGRLRDVLPETDSIHDLGAPGREWSRAFVDHVSASSMTVSTLTVTNSAYLATTSGNVGVGTSNPSTKLHISGGIRFDGGSDPGSYAALYLDAINGPYPAYLAAPTIRFNIGANDSRTTKVTIDSSGNVGIGTTSPYSKLTNHTANVTRTSGNGCSTNSLIWSLNEAGYSAAVNQAASGGSNNQDGLLVKIAGTNAANHVLTLVAGASDVAYVTGDGSAWFIADVSALTFTDRTPYPKSKQEAYDAVLSMQAKPDKSGVDHTKLSDSIRVERTKQVWDDVKKSSETVTYIEGRNLSATVSALNEVVKDLLARIEALEKDK